MGSVKQKTQDKNSRMAEIDEQILKNFDMKKKLGKGAYGIVWKAIDKKTQQTVAVKKIFDAFSNETDAQRTFREIMFLRAFRNHPNIIQLHSIHRATNHMDIYLSFEFMESDLHNVIKRGTILKDIHKQYVMYQLLNAIQYIHSGNVIHRDMKPSNVLVDSKCRCKIADFGLARSLSKQHQNLPQNKSAPIEQCLTDYVATRWYRAPEIVVASKKYTKGIDMWSLGCILGEMIRGKPLFPGSCTINQMERIIAALPEVTEKDVESVGAGFGSALLNSKQTTDNSAINNQLLKLDDLLSGSSKDAKLLVNALLVLDPMKRLTARQALDYKYVEIFRNTSPENVLNSDVVPPFRDDVQLTVSEYRTKLYEIMSNHEKNGYVGKIIDKRNQNQKFAESMNGASDGAANEKKKPNYCQNVSAYATPVIFPTKNITTKNTFNHKNPYTKSDHFVILNNNNNAHTKNNNKNNNQEELQQHQQQQQHSGKIKLLTMKDQCSDPQCNSNLNNYNWNNQNQINMHKQHHTQPYQDRRHSTTVDSNNYSQSNLQFRRAYSNYSQQELSKLSVRNHQSQQLSPPQPLQLQQKYELRRQSFDNILNVNDKTSSVTPPTQHRPQINKFSSSSQSKLMPSMPKQKMFNAFQCRSNTNNNNNNNNIGNGNCMQKFASTPLIHQPATLAVHHTSPRVQCIPMSTGKTIEKFRSSIGLYFKNPKSTSTTMGPGGNCAGGSGSGGGGGGGGGSNGGGGGGDDHHHYDNRLKQLEDKIRKHKLKMKTLSESNVCDNKQKLSNPMQVELQSKKKLISSHSDSIVGGTRKPQHDLTRTKSDFMTNILRNDGGRHLGLKQKIKFDAGGRGDVYNNGVTSPENRIQLGNGSIIKRHGNNINNNTSNNNINSNGNIVRNSVKQYGIIRATDLFKLRSSELIS